MFCWAHLPVTIRLMRFVFWCMQSKYLVNTRREDIQITHFKCHCNVTNKQLLDEVLSSCDIQNYQGQSYQSSKMQESVPRCQV